MSSEDRHSVEIEFCIPCDFRPQALALTKELLDGWATQLAEIRLVPSSGGRFEVSLDGETIFSKAQLDREPGPGEIAGAIERRIGRASAPLGA
jgi:selenoprotein W-related protein